jgi:hypothetical protein
MRLKTSVSLRLRSSVLKAVHILRQAQDDRMFKHQD